MTKSLLRQNMIGKLKNLSVQEKKGIEQKLFFHLVCSKYWKQANVIGITISQMYEWNTKPIIQKAWKNDKRIVIPKCFPKDKKIEFYQFESYEQLEIGFYNLLEPNTDKCEIIEKSKIDLLVVPGLVFDKRGYRIGFGGGYYDRYLNEFCNQSISIVSSDQIVNCLPIEPFDVPVKHMITEQGFFK